MKRIVRGFSWGSARAGGLLVVASLLFSAACPAQVPIPSMPTVKLPDQILWEGKAIPLAGGSTKWFYWGSVIVSFTWREDIECLDLGDLVAGTPLGYLEIFPTGSVFGDRSGALVVVRQSAEGWEIAIVGEGNRELDSRFGVVTCRNQIATSPVSVNYRSPLASGSPDFERMSADELDSGFVNGACYDLTNELLVLKLRDTWYHYYNVPERVWQGFKEADAKGEFYNANIRGVYDCQTHPVVSYVSHEFYLTDQGVLLSLRWDDFFVLGFIPLDVLTILSGSPAASSCGEGGP